MFKSCPKCQKPNPIEARICTCGYWFVNPEAIAESFNLPHLRKTNLKRKVKKSLILAGFIILSGAAIFWGGFIDPVQISESEREKASPADDNLPLHKPAPKNAMEGRVIAVNSGDMITVLDKNNQQYEIRLGGIDAPGLKQEFGEAAKENLSKLILNKTVQLVLQKKDDDGLLVSKVLLDGVNINLEQVKAGFARQNKDSVKEQPEEDNKFYANAETAAKTAKIGLWANETPTAPPEVKPDVAAVSPVEEAQTSGIMNKPLPNVAQEEPSLPPEKNILEAGSKTGNNTTLNNISATPLPSPALITVSQPTPETEFPPTISNKPKPTVTSVNATARCRDGSLSFSTTSGGACSRHGGVAEWLDGPYSPAKTRSNSRTYILGSRGGCYYISSNGKKSYVDRSLCN